MTVRIISDTSCNVPEQYYERLNIPQVPAWINFSDGTSLRNGVDISDAEFYRRLTTEKNLPTTAQPTPGEFAEAAEALDADEIILAAVSSKLSGTYSSAVQAVELVPDKKIYPFDTLSASMGSAWQIIAGAELAAQGAPVDIVLAEMERVRNEVETMFVIDTLKYLAASGRAPAVQAFVGSLLNIKPLLEFNDGRIEPCGKVRGRKRSKREMLDRFEAWADGRPLRLGIANANVPDEANEYAAMVKDRLDVREMAVCEIGPVLGALAGPGTIAIGAYVWSGK